MAYQSTNEQRYYKVAEVLLDVEAALTKAVHSKNKELSQFARVTLRRIEEGREQNDGK